MKLLGTTGSLVGFRDHKPPQVQYYGLICFYTSSILEVKLQLTTGSVIVRANFVQLVNIVYFILCIYLFTIFFL